MALESSSMIMTSAITPDSVKQAIAHLTTAHPKTNPSNSLKIVAPEWMWDIYCIQQTSSTNVALWQLLDDSPDRWLQTTAAPVLIAQEQTHGRGQRSRHWLSPPGGLYLSTAIPIDVTARDMPIITLSTACGIASLLNMVGLPVQLKWPNDLVVAGQKLGGILIESRLQGDRLSRCIVGVGINWMNPVPSTGVSLHSLLTAESAHYCRQLSDVAALVLLGIEAGILHWQRHGKEAIADTYTQFLNSTHQWIQIPESVGDRYSCGGGMGQVVGVSSEGSLLVEVSAPHPAESHIISFAPGTISIGYGQE